MRKSCKYGIFYLSSQTVTKCNSVPIFVAVSPSEWHTIARHGYPEGALLVSQYVEVVYGDEIVRAVGDFNHGFGEG